MKFATRRRAAIVAVVGIFAGGLAVSVSTSATPGDSQALGNSNFEIDEDANLKVDDPTPPSLDWANVNETIGFDLPTGQNDDSYKGGVKEDTECPGEVTGSIPNNKSDLLTFHAFTEEGAGADPGYFNLAWSRVSEPAGTTLMDVEFNQSTVACSVGPNVERTIGDLLIEYGISQGGAVATLLAREWDGSEWGPQEDISTPLPQCGGDPCAVGTINQSVIPLAESEELNADKDLFTFGEAQIDLDYIFENDKCVSFGSAQLKSRSSDSFNSQLKDFISPVPINLTNCGQVIVRKVTDPTGDTTDFGFTKAFATDPVNGNTFDLADAESQTFTGVLFGTGLTVTEDTPPSGWDLVGVNCSASTGVTPVIAGALVTFDIDAASDVLDCTYTNRARAKITYVKNAEIDDVDFSFSGDNGAFVLANGESKSFDGLSPGTYGASETVPSGWNLDSENCDNGDTADAVTLAAGDDVTCTFVNTIRGAVSFAKDAERAGTTFQYTGDGVADFGLADGESVAYTDLTSGTYGASETVPDGWNLVSATCDDGSDPAGVVIDQPGESVNCTFVNEIERGAIDISKVAKDAAAGGEKPLAGVEFTVTNVTNGTDVTVATDADGVACVDGLPVSVLDGDYTVTETVPNGYAPVSPQDVTVVESTCGTAAAVDADFVNIPLTNVTISVDSRVDGGTASLIECVSDEYGSTGQVATGVDGDGSVTVNNLSPTDPAVTITCTVIIDP